jgi:hypothetical protein
MGCLYGAASEAAGESAPAAATYVRVVLPIESIRQAWAKPGNRDEPNAGGWSALFDSVIAHLQIYSRANAGVARPAALNRLLETSMAFDVMITRRHATRL